MVVTTWLRSLCSPYTGVLSAPHAVRRSRRHRTPIAALRSEDLEVRCLLSTFYVDEITNYVETTNGGGTPGVVDDGDTVTWDPGLGSAHGGPVANLTFGTDAFTTLTEAIGPAVDNDTILIGSGIFTEGVSITESLTILGNQTGIDATTGRVGAPETIISHGGGAFGISAAGVTIDGLVVQDQNASSAPGFGHGIFLSPAAAGTVISNNIIQNNVSGIALANSGAVDAVIENNLFRNNTNAGPASGHSIYADEFTSGGNVQNVTIQNNTFTNTSLVVDTFAIGLSNTGVTAFDNITISNNTITNHGRGMYLSNTTNSVVSGNTITGTSNYAIGLFDFGAGVPDSQNIAFTDNTLDNNNRGFWVDNSGYAGALTITGGSINNATTKALDITGPSVTQVTLDGVTISGGIGGTLTDVATVRILTGAGDDVVNIGANGLTEGQFNVEDTLATIDFTGVNSLEIDTQGGDDTIKLAAHGTTEITVDAGPDSTGDRIKYFLTTGKSYSVGNTTIETEDQALINYANFEIAEVDLSGMWFINGLSTYILQNDTTLTLVNENGGSAEGRVLTGTTIIADTWGGLNATVSDDMNRIDWDNGSVWTRADLTPIPVLPEEFEFNGLHTHLEQHGVELIVTNEHGDASRARFLSPTQIVASEWGDLIGTLSLDNQRIDWSNASAWTTPATAVPTPADVSGAWLINGVWTQITQSQRALTLFNERGEVSSASLSIDNQTITANVWNITGQVSGNQINWSNGSQWTRTTFSPPALSQDWIIGDNQVAQIQPNNGQLLLTNEHGDTSRAVFLSSGAIRAVDWNVTGVLSAGNSVITWSNNSQWTAAPSAADQYFADDFNPFA